MMTCEPDETDREAAKWVDRMNRPVQSSEIAAAFDRWIIKDPRNVDAYARMQALWQSGSLRGALDGIEAATAPAGVNDDAPVARESAKGRRLAALVLAIVCLIAAMPLIASLTIAPSHIRTEPGETRVVSLTDGSRITLSGGSQIAVRFTPWSRDVSLDQGQAFFDVAHERWRGFAVATDHTDVEVLGTAFDVDRVKPGTLRVRVFRGLVGVKAASGAHWHLPAASAAELTDGALRRLPPPVGDRPGWLDGWFDASSTPVAEMVERMNRHSRVPVSLSDPAIGELMVSGRFKIAEPEMVLDALSATHGLRWRKTQGAYVLSRQ